MISYIVGLPGAVLDFLGRVLQPKVPCHQSFPGILEAPELHWPSPIHRLRMVAHLAPVSMCIGLEASRASCSLFGNMTGLQII